MSRADDFRASFSPPPADLPERISLQYEAESCLREQPVVWRLRRRADGQPFLLKTAPAEADDLAEEFQVLGRLWPLLPGAVPVPADCFQENGVSYLVRSYLPGETLAQHRERTGSCSVTSCVQLGRKLCTLLETVHKQGLIHRDVKPENIILLPDGGVGLIDFGIARQYKEGQDRDTRHLGTRSTAAPEQYGYVQTDRRTDIYGLGMTLLWLVSGSYDREEALSKTPEPLRRTLERATAFSPKDRYPDAAAFSKALPGARKRPLGLLAAVFAVILAGVLGLSLRGNGRPVEFQSQSLEIAVRAALERPEGEITVQDLSGIQRLAIVGNQTFGPEARFEYRVGCYLDNVLQEERGDLADLSLLAQMPNLTELYLCRQEIQDLTPLEKLPLTALALCENRITDLSPLKGLTSLETLYLSGNPITDAEVLSGLTGLRLLNLGGNWDAVMVLENFDFLAPLSLWELGLSRAIPEDRDWSPLETQAGLDTLQLCGPPEEALAVVNRLENLRSIHIVNYPSPDLTPLSGLKKLEILSLFSALDSLDGIGGMENLRTLALGNSAVTDLTPLLETPRLDWLHLNNVPVTDFTPLAGLHMLKHVQVNQDQGAAVEAACPGYTFELAFN